MITIEFIKIIRNKKNQNAQRMMQFKTLENTNIRDITTCFNHAFSDYFIPFELTEGQLADKMRADMNDLSLSVGAFDDSRLVGFMLHGVKRDTDQCYLYNGGTGVIPESRGQGITKKMYEFILPKLKSAQINGILLEAIDMNTQAIRSYEHAGFRTLRKVTCYKGSFKSDEFNDLVQIKDIQHYDWQLLGSCWETTPT